MKRLIKHSVFDLNVNSPEELLKWMNKNISYGYMRKDHTLHINDIVSYDEGYDFFMNYSLQSPEELFNNRFGVCLDQTEFQRYMFNKMGIENYVIYMIQNNKDFSTHSYSVLRLDGDFYWFENSWDTHKGIHGPFNSINEISKLVHDKAVEADGKNDAGYDAGILQQPKYGIGCVEYMTFAKRSINSSIDFHYEFDHIGN